MNVICLVVKCEWAVNVLDSQPHPPPPAAAPGRVTVDEVRIFREGQCGLCLL